MLSAPGKKERVVAIARVLRAGLTGILVLVAAACGNGDPAGEEAEPPRYPSPITVTGSVGVHDPTIVERQDGTYLVAYTGNYIALKTSKDRIDYTEAGPAFPKGAAWTLPYTNGSTTLWAPDLSFHDGLYYMYYSASTFGSNHSAIFLATSKTGDPGTWTNKGLVIESKAGDNYNAIDPNLFVDGSGHWWLTFGSFWSGIQQVEVAAGTGLPIDTNVRLIAGRGGDAIEAPFLFLHGGYYYLYVSFDKCCQGASSTYRTMVGRSTTPTGPFVDKAGKPMAEGGGTEVLAGHDAVHGPGHPAVFTDNDSDVLVYHYYVDSGASQLGINLISYDSAGWPFLH
jgi:arabinan endo-1,5-alpha-L-arabinosidase